MRIQRGIRGACRRALLLLVGAGCSGGAATSGSGLHDGGASIELPPGIVAQPIAGATKLPAAFTGAEATELVLDGAGNAFVRSRMGSSIVLTRFDHSTGWGAPAAIETNALQPEAVWGRLFLDADDTPTVLWGPQGDTPIHVHRFMGDQGWVALPGPDPALVHGESAAVGAHGQIALLDTKFDHYDMLHHAVWALVAQVFDPPRGWSAVTTLYTGVDAGPILGIAGLRTVIASDGTVVAIWNDSHYTSDVFFWARYTTGDGWSQPAQLSCLDPQLLTDRASNVVALCEQANAIGIRRLRAGSWTSPQPLPEVPASTENMVLANGTLLYVLLPHDSTMRLARVSETAMQELDLMRGPRWAGVSNLAMDPQGGVVILWQEEVPREPVAGEPGFYRGPVRHLFYGRVAPGSTSWSKLAQLDGDDGMSTGAGPLGLAMNDRGQAMAVWSMSVVDQAHGLWSVLLP